MKEVRSLRTQLESVSSERNSLKLQLGKFQEALLGSGLFYGGPSSAEHSNSRNHNLSLQRSTEQHNRNHAKAEKNEIPRVGIAGVSAALMTAVNEDEKTSSITSSAFTSLPRVPVPQSASGGGVPGSVSAPLSLSSTNPFTSSNPFDDDEDDAPAPVGWDGRR